MLRQLSPEDTEAELAIIGTEVEPYFEKAMKTALDRARIQMAQVIPLGRKRVKIKKNRSTSDGRWTGTVFQDLIFAPSRNHFFDSG